jgi:membrane carboxypeptidase/penicillin-binding protein
MEFWSSLNEKLKKKVLTKMMERNLKLGGIWEQHLNKIFFPKRFANLMIAFWIDFDF